MKYKTYTAMYGKDHGFYHIIKARTDQEAIDRAFAYMKTKDYRSHPYGPLELYEIFKGNFSDKESHQVIWDYYNGETHCLDQIFTGHIKELKKYNRTYKRTYGRI